MSKTVEAIQCELMGIGFILFPGTPENPPRFIDSETLQNGHYRLFPRANPRGPLFTYRYSPVMNTWVLQHD